MSGETISRTPTLASGAPLMTLRASPPPPSVNPARGRGRILLVDDDDRVRRAYGIMLRRANFVVEEADSGKAARERLASERFDLVISDISLTDTTGLELLRAARLLDGDLPVVLMTGGAELPMAIEAVELGALHFLLKPVDRAVLCEAAEDGLRERERARLERHALEHYALHAAEREARRTTEVELDEAVAAIGMAYQPIVRLSSRGVIAYEALVRPRAPRHFTPMHLFDAAEKTNRLHEVGRAIRTEVASDLVRAQREVEVFVNLHPRDLFDDKLFDASAPLSWFARRVTLELTERAPLHDIPDLRERVEALQALGFRIAIDDLGAGYADLMALSTLRPDVVKLDMSLTRGVSRDARRQTLVRTIRNLCAEIGTTFVVEGVETHEELETLEDLGCDVFQGALFGMPSEPFTSVAWDHIVSHRD